MPKYIATAVVLKSCKLALTKLVGSRMNAIKLHKDKRKIKLKSDIKLNQGKSLCFLMTFKRLLNFVASRNVLDYK